MSLSIFSFLKASCSQLELVSFKCPYYQSITWHCKINWNFPGLFILFCDPSSCTDYFCCFVNFYVRWVLIDWNGHLLRHRESDRHNIISLYWMAKVTDWYNNSWLMTFMMFINLTLPPNCVMMELNWQYLQNRTSLLFIVPNKLNERKMNLK